MGAKGRGRPRIVVTTQKWARVIRIHNDLLRAQRRGERYHDALATTAKQHGFPSEEALAKWFRRNVRRVPPAVWRDFIPPTRTSAARPQLSPFGEWLHRLGYTLDPGGPDPIFGPSGLPREPE